MKRTRRRVTPAPGLRNSVKRLRSHPRGLLLERVLETQVEKDPPLSRAGENAHWNRHARDNLQSACEVVRPAYSGAQADVRRPRRTAGTPEGLIPAVRCLDQGIESRVEQIDDAVAQVVSQSAGDVSVRASRLRNERCAGIPVCDNARMQRHAEREVDLNSDAACSTSACHVAGRHKNRDPRGKATRASPLPSNWYR